MTMQKGVIIARNVSHTVVAASLTLRCYENNRAGDYEPIIIVEKVINDITIEENNPLPIPFDLNVPSQGDFLLFVHIDVGGSGQIDIGDFLTTYAATLPTDRSAMTVWVDQIV